MVISIPSMPEWEMLVRASLKNNSDTPEGDDFKTKAKKRRDVLSQWPGSSSRVQRLRLTQGQR